MTSTSALWHKYEDNPVLGGKELGTIFDVSVVKIADQYWMYSSWRPRKSIALSKSSDGIHWSDPEIVLQPSHTGWEDEINRPGVLHMDGLFHLWYTGQADGHSAIGYATSLDGLNFTRLGSKPVLQPDQPWESVAVMCPYVLWDEGEKEFRMWYSGGEQYEPDAIGYATSPDGTHWQKRGSQPVFTVNPSQLWEQDKVTGCQIILKDGWYLMFYIGFENLHLARIGIARSRDGIREWQRHPVNPIIGPTPQAWDQSSCYKPFAVFEKEQNRWLLWYNGRSGDVEAIGLAIHNGEDLGW